MPTVNLPFFPTAGQPENIAHVTANDVALRDAMNGTLDATNFATSAKPATLLGAYRTIAQGFDAGTSAAFNAAGTYVINEAAGSVNQSPSAASKFGPLVPIRAADLAVTGLTTQVRLQVALAVNAVAPARTFTFGLYPITMTGSGSFTVTLGTVVTGTTVAFASPAASSETVSVSNDITIPADGIYMFGVVLAGGAITANSGVNYMVTLQSRHV